ncbi:MAG: cell division protein FtsZ [Campylobacterota bacterium]
MSSDMFIIEESTRQTGARIVAVGVGGGGGNMIGHMINEGVTGIELVVANTDAQVLDKSLANTKIQLGDKLTKGLGAGMKPSIGKDSALESYDELHTALNGADIVFIAAGLGGGTGTGAAPIVAQIAKEIGALTIAVVTKPFKFEGGKRSKLAEKGLEDLKSECDSIVVIPNDKLLSIIDKRLGMRESFKIVDSVLAQAVSGTSGVILSHGDNDINLDFADLQTVMCHRGMALMGVGEYQGENAAYEAIKAAIESPLLDNMSINGAMGVLVHFHMHPEFPMMEMTEAMEIVHESADTEADVIFGTTTDDSMPVDAIRITLVATGFEKDLNQGVNNDTFVSDAPTQPTTTQQTLRPKMVVGGDLSDDYLDVPTYMRQQKD